MRKLTLMLMLLLSFSLRGAETLPGDVFFPISKYIRQGNPEALSAWFADNLEIAVISRGENCSRSQAIRILKNFYDSYTPRSFEIIHTAGRPEMKYALGILNAGGENFLVTLFVSLKGNSFLIQQIKIERSLF